MSMIKWLSSILLHACMYRLCRELKRPTEALLLTGARRSFPTFVKFIKASEDDEKELRNKLSTEFQSLGKYLEANGPFLKGENISAARPSPRSKAVPCLHSFQGV